MYNRYAESGRVNWFANHYREEADAGRQTQWRDLMSPRGIGLILRSIKTDYKFVSQTCLIWSFSTRDDGWGHLETALARSGWTGTWTLDAKHMYVRARPRHLSP